MKRNPWLRALVATVLIALTPFALPAEASAGAAMSATSGYQDTLAVGDSLDTQLTIANLNTAPDTTLTLNTILFVPSCGTSGPIGDDCPAGSADPGSLIVTGAPTGVASTACAGLTFDLSNSNASTGRVELTPSAPVVLAAPTSSSAADQCTISIRVQAQSMPTFDSRPGTPGVQTDGFAVATGTSSGGVSAISSGGSGITVAPAAEPPGIRVIKTATPLSRPEPGGTFSFGVAVTNSSAVPLTVTSLSDDVYGDIATKGTCTSAVSTVLAPGDELRCAFPGELRGNAGMTQTDVVTVTAVDGAGATATDDDDAVVSLTDVPPTITVAKTALPEERAAPGGLFTFSAVITNTSFEPVTVTKLDDDVYGDLSRMTGSTCAQAIGRTIAPGAQLSCTFTGGLTGAAGKAQTDIVTVTVTDDDGSIGTAKDDATIRLVAPGAVTSTTTLSPTTTTSPKASSTTTATTVQPTTALTTSTTVLARTGTQTRARTMQAVSLLGAGLLLIGVSWCREARLRAAAGAGR